MIKELFTSCPHFSHGLKEVTIGSFPVQIHVHEYKQMNTFHNLPYSKKEQPGGVHSLSDGL